MKHKISINKMLKEPIPPFSKSIIDGWIIFDELWKEKMTKYEEFFEKVRNKKIRLSTLNWNDMYIVPYTHDDNLMEASVFTGDGRFLYVNKYDIRNGFDMDRHGQYWLYMDESESKDNNKECTCDSLEMFRKGCKCGGK